MNLNIIIYLFTIFFTQKVSQRPDSNQGPRDQKSSALSTLPTIVLQHCPIKQDLILKNATPCIALHTLHRDQIDCKAMILGKRIRWLRRAINTSAKSAIIFEIGYERFRVLTLFFSDRRSKIRLSLCVMSFFLVRSQGNY